MAYMEQPRLFSRGQLSELAQADPGAVTFWLRHNLLRAATGGGDGTHRRFHKSQVVVARVLVEARDVGLNIEALRVLAKNVSDALTLADVEHVSPSDFTAIDAEEQRRAVLNGALDGMPEYYVSMRQHAEAKKTLARIETAKAGPVDLRISDIVDKAEARGARFASLFKSLLVGEGMIHLFKADGEWIVENKYNIEGGLPARCSVVFDMEKIFKDIDWPSANVQDQDNG